MASIEREGRRAAGSEGATGSRAAGAGQEAAIGAARGESNVGFYAVLAISAAVMVYTIHFIFFTAPTEASMGFVQKIFYFHVPAAYAMYLGATACFVGSAGYLWKGTAGWDSLAKAGAEVAVATGLMVLISGPLWAAKAWGVYWTWDPRLTTSMLSFLIYVAYVVLRAFAGGGESDRKFSAALGILGGANLPIIHYSVQKWGGTHPAVISGKGGGLQHPDMKIGLALGFLTFTLLAAVLIWQRVRIDLANSRLARVEQEALELGVVED
jgi:heme exporter protein C